MYHRRGQASRFIFSIKVNHTIIGAFVKVSRPCYLARWKTNDVLSTNPPGQDAKSKRKTDGPYHLRNEKVLGDCLGTRYSHYFTFKYQNIGSPTSAGYLLNKMKPACVLLAALRCPSSSPLRSKCPINCTPTC